MRAKILTYSQFILNEDNKSSTFSDDDFKFDDNKESNSAATPPAAGANETAPVATIPPSADGSTPPPADSSTPLPGEDSTTPTPAAGSTDLGSGGANGVGGGAPSAPIGPDPLAGGPGEEGQANFKPNTTLFTVILNDPEAKWKHEYPSGGGVKKMKTFEISWIALEKWIDNNNLKDQTEDITNFLLGKENKLNREVKLQIKAAMENDKLGIDSGTTDIEFDEKDESYTGDINTVVLNFDDEEKP